MKKISLLPLLFFLCISFFQMQSKTELIYEFEAGRSFISNTSLTASTNTTLPHDTCVNKKFSLVFYLIQDSAFTLPNNPASTFSLINTVASYSINNIVAKLNETFARICVSFENCKTVIIPNHQYNRWILNTVDSVVTHNYYMDSVINVYMPTLLLNPQADHYYAYTSTFPLTPTPLKDFIVLEKGFALTLNGANFSGSILLHAFGHFFGLEHTYAEISNAAPYGPSTEALNGSNCYTHGDGFCDTDPDPYPISYEDVYSGPCNYKYSVGATDAGGTYYLPPVDNIMSAYGCRCRFTQEQYNYMAHIIITKRFYLH